MKRILIGAILFGLIAGTAYLSTLGCCQLMAPKKRPVAFSDQLQLTPAQKKEVVSLEQNFLTLKGATCQRLCAKRAQLIQSLKGSNPDPATLKSLVEEIGQEQTALENSTLEHLIALRRNLDPPQQEKLVQLMTEELRTACKDTACGVTPGCAVTEGVKK